MADGGETKAEVKDPSPAAPAAAEGAKAQNPSNEASKGSEARQDVDSKQEDGGKKSEAPVNKPKDKYTHDAEGGVGYGEKKGGKEGGDDVKGARSGGGWNKTEQVRKHSGGERPPGRFSKQNRQEAAGKNEIRGKAEMESYKEEGGQQATQPKGKRYERDRRESWRGRNERRNQQQQQQQQEKTTDSGHAEGGGSDHKDDQDQNEASDSRYKGATANSHKRSDLSRKDSGKDKPPSKSKSDSGQSYQRDGRGSDQSGRGDGKDGRDRESRNNRQHGKDSRQGSARGGAQGNGTRRANHGDGEKYSGTGEGKHRGSDSKQRFV